MKSTITERFMLRGLGKYLPNGDNIFYFNNYDLLVKNNEIVILKRVLGRKFIDRITTDQINSYEVSFSKTSIQTAMYWGGLTTFIIITISSLFQDLRLFYLSLPFLGIFAFADRLVQITIEYEGGFLHDIGMSKQVLRWTEFMRKLSKTKHN